MRSDEAVQRAVARGLGCCPSRSRAGSPGAPPPRWRGAALDARTAALMAMAARRGQSFRPEVELAAMRAGYARMNRVCGLPAGGVARRGVTIPTDEGEIAARLYLPRGTSFRSRCCCGSTAAAT